MRASHRTNTLLAIFAVLALVWALPASAVESTGFDPSPQSMSRTFVELVNQVGPAVVNIHVVKVIHGGFQYQGPMGPNDPFRDFFEKFMGPQGDFKQRGQGSGFIIDPQGYVVTNNHVVDGAEKITVRFSDEKQADAEVIGTDPNTDIALLKIIESGTYPSIPLGDSETLRVGEWVIAIGNPFGLDNTVTAGIVSAKGRILGANTYEDYIQTDASINPGNSGGPLINLAGEVVGVNTLISASGQGIGFAIPINLARTIFTQLRERGKVVRGWLGVGIQPLNEDLAESFDAQDVRGALVNKVFEDTPAQKAGIKIGDVIVEYDGKPVKSPMDLSLMVAETDVDSKVVIKVLREGGKKTFKVRIAQREEEKIAGAREPEDSTKLGLSVQEITPDLADRFGLADARGVLVTRIAPGSPADDAGLRRGDVLLEVDQVPIASTSEFKQQVAKAKSGEAILLLVVRGENTFFTTMKKP